MLSGNSVERCFFCELIRETVSMWISPSFCNKRDGVDNLGHYYCFLWQEVFYEFGNVSLIFHPFIY